MQDDPMMGNGIEEKFYLSIEKNVDQDTPPMFIWQTMSDDGRNGMCLAKALQDAEVHHLKKQQQQAVPLRKLPQKQHRQKLLQQQAILIQAKKSVLTHVKMVQVQEVLS